MCRNERRLCSAQNLDGAFHDHHVEGVTRATLDREDRAVRRYCHVTGRQREGMILVAARECSERRAALDSDPDVVRAQRFENDLTLPAQAHVDAGIDTEAGAT